MLITKPLKKNDVVSVKLITGEEIIGRFEGDDDDGFHVSKASVVAANPEGGLGLVPWMMSSAPEKITINKSTVVTYAPTVEQIADKFTEATSSIQVVK
jgi:hypothetical protein